MADDHPNRLSDQGLIRCELNRIGCPSALTGTSHCFKWVVAAAIKRFDLESGVAMVTEASVVLEVPVKPLVANVANNRCHSRETGASKCGLQILESR